MLFEISCTQDFQILFSKGNNSEKGHNSDKKKIQVNYFFMRNIHMKFQIPTMHHSKVNRRTHGRTHTHTHTHTHTQPDTSHRCGFAPRTGHEFICETSHVLLAGVSGGFSPGTPVFAPPTD